MLTLLNNTKISFFKAFYLFCFIIYAGSATVFARSIGNISTVGNAFAVLLTFIFIVGYRIKFNRNYFITISIFIAFAIATFINNGVISALWLTQWLLWLTFGYCICKGLRRKLFVAYETLIFWLCIISLPLWILTCVDFGVASSLINFFQFSESYFPGGNVLANMVVFTLSRFDIIQNAYTWLPRNPGFAWEPGAFSTFIVLAIFCNLLRTKFSFRRNYPLWMLLFTLITTQSTSGIMILLGVFVVWLFFHHQSLKLLFLLPIMLLLFNIPFVKNKFVDEYYAMRYVNIDNIESDRTQAMGRLYSLKLEWEEFLRHPVLGLGGYAGGSYLKQAGYNNIGTVSGIGKLLSRFGLIMSSLFFYCLFRSSKALSRLYNSSNGYLLFVVTVGIMFSYNIWMQPLLISFWMYGVYMKTTKTYSIKKILAKYKLTKTGIL